jgi:hypothetical protein
MSGVSDHKSNLSDEAMQKATGRHPSGWFELLDAQQATNWTHTEIARWLVEDQSVDAWWAQSVTVRYEQERGMRLPGQQGDGTFSVGSTKTITAPIATVYGRMVELLTTEYGQDAASANRAAKRPYARWKVHGESVLATCEDRGPKTMVNLTHSGIIDGSRVEHAKPELARLLTELAASV